MPFALKTQNDSFKFVHEHNKEMHADLKYVESLEKEIGKLDSDKAEYSNMYDILLQECVSNDDISHVSLIPLLPILRSTSEARYWSNQSEDTLRGGCPQCVGAGTKRSHRVDVRSRESSEFYSRHYNAQKDHAAVRAEIEVLRRERLTYEKESMETRQALARSEAYCSLPAVEHEVTCLETEVRRHEWQRQAADDFAVRHIMRTQALEARARVDTLEDTHDS
ncbi:hypothetical protein Tco_0673684 [Tanacetum coccineum]